MANVPEMWHYASANSAAGCRRGLSVLVFCCAICIAATEDGEQGTASPCAHPDDFCSYRGSRLEWQDCDDDGIADLFCEDPEDLGVFFSSAFGCHIWPTSMCNTTIIKELHRRSVAEATRSVTRSATAPVHFGRAHHASFRDQNPSARASATAHGGKINRGLVTGLVVGGAALTSAAAGVGTVLGLRAAHHKKEEAEINKEEEVSGVATVADIDAVLSARAKTQESGAQFRENTGAHQPDDTGSSDSEFAVPNSAWIVGGVVLLLLAFALCAFVASICIKKGRRKHKTTSKSARMMSKERLSRLPEEEVEFNTEILGEENQAGYQGDAHVHLDSVVEVRGEYADHLDDMTGPSSVEYDQAGYGEQYGSPSVARFQPFEPVASWISPRQAGTPMAAIPIDLNHDGHADFALVGPDLNRNGVPDAIDQAMSARTAMPFGNMTPQSMAQPMYPQGMANPPMYSVGMTVGQASQYNWQQFSQYGWQQPAWGGYQPPGMAAPIAPHYC